MAVVFLTITPLGTGTPSVSSYVAGVERILRGTGLKHQLTAMGTIIEGDLDEILSVVRRMHEHPFTLWQRFPFLERHGDGTFHLPDDRPSLPMLYSLRARLAA